MQIFSKLFQGRIGRKDFFVLTVIVHFFGIATIMPNLSNDSIWLPLFLVHGIALFSLAVRRLHDLDTRGLSGMAVFVPYLNIFFCIYLALQKGNPQENKYGVVPQKRPLIKVLFNI